METTPVFVFTGFVESGKTTMIQRWLTQQFFIEQEKLVLIVCEDGFTEFDEEKLKNDGTELFMLNNKEEFNSGFLGNIEKNHKPSAVIIESNCMVPLEEVLDIEWPENWDVVEITAMIDASTFDSQMKNMRPIMIEQFKYASVVVFNRCDENTKKLQLRGSIKAVNPEASVIFINKNGQVDEELDELPFDLKAPVVKIEDIDYGLWFVDVFENCGRYDGKTVQFKGMVSRPAGYPETSFLAGRNAMTCCADDIAFLKLLCVTETPSSLKEGEWVSVTARVQVCQPEGVDESYPVFYVSKIENAQPPESEYVYFS